jgi:hypothetical protein
LSGGPSQKEEREERRDLKINKIIKNMRKSVFRVYPVSFPGILLFAVVSIHCIYHLFFTLAFLFLYFSLLFGFFETTRSPASSVTKMVR